jgi:hypothetical protein
MNKPLAHQKPSVREPSISSGIVVLRKGGSSLWRVSLGPSQVKVPWLQMQSHCITKVGSWFEVIRICRDERDSLCGVDELEALSHLKLSE